MLRKKLITTTLFCCLSLLVTAQNEQESGQSNTEDDKYFLERDKGELEAFQSKVTQYKEVVSAGETLKLKNLHIGLLDDMAIEIEQTKAKISLAEKGDDQSAIEQLRKRLKTQEKFYAKFEKKSKNIKALNAFLITLHEDIADTQAKLVMERRENRDAIRETNDKK